MRRFVYSLTLTNGIVQALGMDAIQGSDLPAVAGLSPGSYTNPSVTVDAAGRIVSASNGPPQSLPAGFLAPYAGATLPPGWLACDGSAVSRTNYAALFAAVGTVWGAGDGLTTFNLPDLRSQVPVGAGQGPGGLSLRTLGETGGSEQVRLSFFNMPNMAFNIAVDTVTASGGTGWDSQSVMGGHNNGDHNLNANFVGTANPVATMPPFAVVQWLIKT